MKKNMIRPKWWLLYLLVVIVLGLFYLEVRSPFSKAEHTWAEVGLVFVIYGLVIAWLNANKAALIAEERKRYHQKPNRGDHDALQNPRSDMTDQEDNNRIRKFDFPTEGRVAPVWLFSVLTMILNFFKTQDK